MSFEIDHETYKDLEIFSDYSGDGSVFSLFNRTKTEGGKKLLLRIMQEPTSNYEGIVKRIKQIQFFCDQNIEIGISYHQLDMIDHYLNFHKKCLHDNFIDALYDHCYYKVNPNNDYYRILTGIKELIKLFRIFSVFFNKIESLAPPDGFSSDFEPFNKFISNSLIQKLVSSSKVLTCFDINSLDKLFRKKEKESILLFLDFVYLTDVLEALAGVKKRTGWCFAEYTLNQSKELIIQGLVHPFIIDPVDNDLVLGDKESVVFLTGPNMAGKSSFFKAVGLSIYLAHLGFPIPAKRMITPVFKGLITTINLQDDISDGLSHFYSEAKRIKKMAMKLLEKGDLFVIMDELFRGTNLKDALEATLYLTSALSRIGSSKFLISSHFTEIAGELKAFSGIAFSYFDCSFYEGKPLFSYKLKEGVSEERLGMYLLKDEEIFSTLEKVILKEG